MTPGDPRRSSLQMATMKAVRYYEYGAPDVLRTEEIERPEAGDGEVLVRVRAASANPYDWHMMRGEPAQVRMMSGMGRPNPERQTLGVDFAGTVETVGAGVTRLRPGDDVFGMGLGAFAEYLVVAEDRVANMPAGVSHEAAAALPIAGITALQALRDHGAIEAGQRVLVIGASGGVGTFAVQIAKAHGAHVTGVCSTVNLDLVRSIGADAGVDYTREDFTTTDQRYDVILDAVGSRPLSESRRALSADGVLVAVAGSGEGDPGLDDTEAPGRVTSMMGRPNPVDLEHLAALVSEGKVTPVIDRRYPLDGVPDAIRYLETERARGKVIITVSPAG